MHFDKSSGRDDLSHYCLATSLTSPFLPITQVGKLYGTPQCFTVTVFFSKSIIGLTLVRNSIPKINGTGQSNTWNFPSYKIQPNSTDN